MIPSCMSALPEMPGVIPTEADLLPAAREDTPTAVLLTGIPEGTAAIRARSRIRGFRRQSTTSITDALNTLDQVPERSALWYYLSGCANAGLGNNVLARDHAAQAVNMEPNNMQYRQLLNQLDFSSRRYQNSPYGNGYGGGYSSCGTGNMCCDLCIADQLCECMGGDCTCM